MVIWLVSELTSVTDLPYPPVNLPSYQQAFFQAFGFNRLANRLGVTTTFRLASLIAGGTLLILPFIASITSSHDIGLPVSLVIMVVAIRLMLALGCSCLSCIIHYSISEVGTNKSNSTGRVCYLLTSSNPCAFRHG